MQAGAHSVSDHKPSWHFTAAVTIDPLVRKVDLLTTHSPCNEK